MGLLSKLAGAAKEGLRKGAINGLLSATGNGSMLDIGSDDNDESRYNKINTNAFYGVYKGVNGNFSADRFSKVSPKSRIEKYPSKYKYVNDEPQGLLKANEKIRNEYNNVNNKIKSDTNSDIYTLKIPTWSYADFINERAVWQKGLSTIFDEPAWFYFKIFFDFNTNHGLFGGLINDTYLTGATNSAAKYLYSNRNLHTQEKPRDRINALYKFASILSFININAPWYFKSIRNLNKAINPIISDFSKEKYIEIEFTPDAIDMRLSTIMSLYNYACYDSLLGKEIIPQNLRKFNMSIILFQSPLRYLHTSYTTNNKLEFLGLDTDKLGLTKLYNTAKNSKVYYKGMSPVVRGFADTMSMKIISLYGCEFDKESWTSLIPNEISSETPFQLGKNSIKITYTYSTEHTMNEFYGMMFGTDGFYFNQYSNFQIGNGDWENVNGLYNNEIENWVNKQIDRYNTLASTFENTMQNGSILGIIDSPKKYKEAIDASEAIMNGIGDTTNTLTNLGVNFALGLLGSSLNTNASQGNLYGDYGLDSAYYKDKLEMLKNGVHERTQAPYFYDPTTGVKQEINKSRNYSAYNLKNTLDSITNFDVNNWLQTNTQKMASSINDKMREFAYGKNPNTTNPFVYNSQEAVNYENSKAGGQHKSTDMIDDPNTWTRTEAPYNYDPQKAIEYENSKAGGQNKVQDMVDGIGNQIHQVTEKPFEYKPEEAVKYETGKSGGQYKSTDMVDDPNTWTRTEKPFNYEPKNAVDYENSKAGDFYKVQNMVDKIGNAEHQVTEKPFNYEPKNAVSYEQGKAGGQYKVQDMVDGIGNAEHGVTEAPFNYDPKNAVSYEQGKAGGQYKNQDMVDGIGNAEHGVTEAPFNYDPKEAVNYENSKAGGQYKVQDMVDGIGNPIHEVTEAPFNYDHKEAVNYENSKAGGQYKVQDMVDGIGNAEHDVTEAPFNYDPKSALEYENSKAGGQYKVQDMVDGIGNAEHEVTEAPFNYDPKSAVEYENSKAGGQYKVQDMVDGIGNPIHEVTEAPFNYDPKSAIEYENSKAGGQYKTQDMVDGIGNAEHEVTEAPFNYDPKSALEYENSKAGGQYKVQDMVDGIGNAEHEVTEAPFNYDPKSAIEYENSKAGGQYKVQDMVDGIGNTEHEVTEAPFNYDPKSALEYENSKAGGQYKTQDMVDGIGNAEHEVTEAPFNYDPKSALEYENSKAGGQYKVQDMVDGIGNTEHEFTTDPYNYEADNSNIIVNSEHKFTESPYNYPGYDAINFELNRATGDNKNHDMIDGINNILNEFTETPFNYNSQNAIEYENNKAGGQNKNQLMTDGIGNDKHEFTEPPYNYDHKSYNKT